MICCLTLLQHSTLFTDLPFQPETISPLRSSASIRPAALAHPLTAGKGRSNKAWLQVALSHQALLNRHAEGGSGGGTEAMVKAGS